MTLPIIWREEAAADLDTLFAEIMVDSPQGALLVDDRIKDQVEVLAQHPFVGRTGRLTGNLDSVRELVVQKTPYVVLYRADEDAVQILRVLHTSRDWPSLLQA